MLGLTLAALAMLEAASSVVWKDDGTVEIAATFAADDPRNPFPQGTKLLTAKAKDACADRGEPTPVSEPVVTGIGLAKGKPQISMRGIYACRKS